jgi:uncharacterized membrane protein YfcA
MVSVGPDTLSLLSLGFFVLSFAIACIAVMAGVGGGVLFTPVMLAFTPIDSLIVRGTGLVVAMFSGLISTGPFMKSGLGNLKLTIYCNIGYGTGAYLGARSAVSVSERLGESGEGFVRIALGAIVFLLAVYFLRGGTNMEWPQVNQVDRFTAWLDLDHAYYETSTNQITAYRVNRAGLGIAAMAGAGVISGFFGLGAGWAIVPTMTLIMDVPLKVAAACSAILIGMGDSISVWPYILAGAVIPFFAATWLVGQVLGGIVGAHLLIRVRSGSIKTMLTGVLVYTGIGLVAKGLTAAGYIPNISDTVYVGVLLLTMAVVALRLTGNLPTLGGTR